MKSFYLIVFAAMLCAVVSCRKERNCTCVTTDSGVKSVRNQTPAVIFTVPGFTAIPLPIPSTFTVSPASDQTTTNPYNVQTTKVTTYEKMKEVMAHQLCESTTEEAVNTSETSVVGSSTITTTNIGSRKTVCTLN